MPPNGSAPAPLTPKQQEVVDYLREHGPTSQTDLAAALGTSLRGVGNRLSALLWRDDVPLRSNGRANAADTVWRLG